jgi:hypothetical protein
VDFHHRHLATADRATAVIFVLSNAPHVAATGGTRRLAAVQAILTPQWMRSMLIVHNIPDNATATEIENDTRIFEAASVVGITLEGLGYSVYARIVPLRVIGDLMGGTIRLAWRKLRPYIEEERRRTGSRKTFEWFEWLARQIERHVPGKTNLEIGAQEAYLDWKP